MAPFLPSLSRRRAVRRSRAGPLPLSVVPDASRAATGLAGRPTEPWGVPHHARPALRSPRLDEAVLALPADAADTVLRVEVAQ